MKKLFWDSLLTADLNTRYWHHLSREYNFKNVCIKSVLSIATIGTVLSWFFIFEVQWLWKMLSLVSAIVALIGLFIDWEKWIERMHLLRKEWIQVKDNYEMLWEAFKHNSKTSADLDQEYKKIKDKEATLAYIGSGLPDKEKLKEECYKEVLRSRGLMNG